MASRGPAALRRRRARPHQPDRVDLPGRQRPGRPQRHLRRAGRGVPRGGQRPRRRRRRPAAGRDDLRHPQREGGDLRPRDALRGARPALAGHHLRHHHRRQRAHPVRPDHRGVLELRAPRPARSPSASTARSVPPRCGRTSPSCRGWPTCFVSCYPNAGPAQRVRRVRRDAGGDGRRARPVRRRRPGQHRRRLLRHHPRAHPRDRRRGAGHGAPRAGPSRPAPCASRAWSRSPSTRTRCSSTSASAPTSPARRGSAT